MPTLRTEADSITRLPLIGTSFRSPGPKTWAHTVCSMQPAVRVDEVATLQTEADSITRLPLIDASLR